MLQDRFVKIMLVIIAVLLAANLLRPAESRPPALFVSSAQAQQSGQYSTAAASASLSVTAIGGYRVSDLKEVVAVGDGQSFVVSNPNGFQVYRVENNTLVRR